MPPEKIYFCLYVRERQECAGGHVGQSGHGNDRQYVGAGKRTQAGPMQKVLGAIFQPRLLLEPRQNCVLNRYMVERCRHTFGGGREGGSGSVMGKQLLLRI